MIWNSPKFTDFTLYICIYTNDLPQKNKSFNFRKIYGTTYKSSVGIKIYFGTWYLGVNILGLGYSFA